MFALSKLVKPFLWPPGIFVLLFMVVGIGYAARRRSGPAVACLGIALAMFCFRKLGIPARPVPCGFRTWEGEVYGWPDWLPRSFEGVAAALHEYLGLWVYRWRYRSVEATR